MHPEIAKTLISQHRDDLVRDTAHGADDHRRLRLPRWHVSWTRTVLAPAGAASAATGSRRSRRGTSLVIIISAHRSA
jgi:hypothetical protein